MPTFLSLFSGIGGLDLGLERAGWECVGQVENDPYCQRVLAKHWPDVPRWEDIKELSPDELPQADLICGGFPCQPVSVAGRRRGQDDERWLWPEFAHIVRHLRPRWVLVENVPGLLVRGMGDVLGDLAASRYDAQWDVIPAAAVGAPHLRERVFIVAHSTSDGLNGQLHEPQRKHDSLEWGEQPQRDGANGSVADPEGFSGELRSPTGERPGGSAGGGHPMGDPEGERRGSGLRQGRASQERPARIFLAEPPDAGWWATEPDVGRVAHGVPRRVDRLRTLGNAVVPQVAELIGRRIHDAWQAAA